MRYVLDVERIIDAPIDEVYRLSVDIAAEAATSSDPTSSVTGEVGVGKTRICQWGPADARCKVTQTFVEIERYRVVYDELIEVPPSPVYTTRIYETMAEYGQGRTRFLFHVEGFPSKDERDIHEEGYNIVLDRKERALGGRARSPAASSG